jgi:hypothetical protein
MVMDVTPLLKWIAAIIKQGIITWSTGSASVTASFYKVEFLDEL